MEGCTSNATPKESDEIQRLDTTIVPFGHMPGDLATRNLVQPPEPLDKMDEKLGHFAI